MKAAKPTGQIKRFVRLFDAHAPENTPGFFFRHCLRSQRIFFYPACGFDWNPLHRFTHLCDTFIYCDINMHVEDFCEHDRSIFKGVAPGIGLKIGAADEVTDLCPETVKELATPEAGRAGEVPVPNESWGKVVPMTRHIGNQKQEIRLLYFRADGVSLYRNLFNKRSIAPRMVCFKQLDVCQDFLKWDKPLGQAVRANLPQPEFIVSAYEPPDFDWPWSQVWQHHKWDSGYGLTRLASYVRPGTPPPSTGKAGDFAWPRRDATIIKLKRPPHVDTNVPKREPVVSLDRKPDVPTLEVALRRLTEIYDRDGDCEVHAIGCHFEDEAPMLAEWKWNNILPKTLTIHCETDGDLACYGPAADEVVD